MKALSFALALLMLAAAPHAMALSATQSVLKEVSTTTPSGEVTTHYIDATLVTPGETIVYRLNYTNDREEPVTEMVLTMPVPGEVTFKDGSADQADMETYFSADGGETFHRRAEVMVALSGDVMAPAGPADITHIRWMSLNPVAAAAQGHLQFKAVLK